MNPCEFCGSTIHSASVSPLIACILVYRDKLAAAEQRARETERKVSDKAMTTKDYYCPVCKKVTPHLTELIGGMSPCSVCRVVVYCPWAAEHQREEK